MFIEMGIGSMGEIGGSKYKKKEQIAPFFIPRNLTFSYSL
jgi:hypothetical protein